MNSVIKTEKLAKADYRGQKSLIAAVLLKTTAALSPEEIAKRVGPAYEKTFKIKKGDGKADREAWAFTYRKEDGGVLASVKFHLREMLKTGDVKLVKAEPKVKKAKAAAAVDGAAAPEVTPTPAPESLPEAA